MNLPGFPNGKLCPFCVIAWTGLAIGVAAIIYCNRRVLHVR